MSLSDILERGYFPKELPDPFVTTSFASAVTQTGVVLPSNYTINFSRLSRRPVLGKPTKYTHARGGLLRRHLSLPNPILFYPLCYEIESNWTTLQSNIGGTSLSASNPVTSTTGRAIQGAHPLAHRRDLAVQTRLNNRYILRTDISRFYHSIYTHSIPWALHTKAAAKANRGMGLQGNRLDYLMRNSQDGQTVGIPIGPDTSLVIAEILMQECDSELLAAIPGIRGYRFIDDYEIGFRHRTEAEEAFHILEKILNSYELALNPRKTEILELPCDLEDPWVDPLRSFEFKTTAKGQEGDLYRYFDLAFKLRGQYQSTPVLQYAIGRLRNLTIDPSNWDLFQRLLLNCVVPEPAVLPYALESIILRVNLGGIPAIADIEDVLNSIIVDHASVGHSSEVAWAMSGCLALNITLSSTAASEVSTCEDSVIALLALHCEAQGLVTAPLNHTVWASYMSQNNLYEEQWLLAYEANIKGWLPSIGGGDHVAADPNFGFLKSAGVSFYDATLAVPVAPGAPAPVPKPPSPLAVYHGSPT